MKHLSFYLCAKAAIDADRGQKKIVKPLRCPYCHDAIQYLDRKKGCGSCMAWHHEDCWLELGRCGTCHKMDPILRPVSAGPIQAESLPIQLCLRSACKKPRSGMRYCDQCSELLRGCSRSACKKPRSGLRYCDQCSELLRGNALLLCVLLLIFGVSFVYAFVENC
jgi:hypothetical protein